MSQEKVKKRLIAPSSAKVRITSGRKTPVKPVLPPPPATAPARAKRPSLPVTPALQMPSRSRAKSRADSISIPETKSAADPARSEKSMPSPAVMAFPKTGPRLSFHAMSMALSMTRRVKQQVTKKRHERGLIDFEPTYRMDPHGNQRFKQGKVEKIIDETLNQLLKDKSYESRSASKLACFVSDAINDKLKEVKMPRYKFVCHVVIGDASAGDIDAVSRCLWNPQTDNYVSVTYSNESIYGVATVFGVYLE